LGYRSWNSSSGIMPWRTLPPFSGRGGMGARLWEDVCREWEAWTSLWTPKTMTALALIGYCKDSEGQSTYTVVHDMLARLSARVKDIPSAKGTFAFQGIGCWRVKGNNINT